VTVNLPIKVYYDENWRISWIAAADFGNFCNLDPVYCQLNLENFMKRDLLSLMQLKLRSINFFIIVTILLASFKGE